MASGRGEIPCRRHNLKMQKCDVCNTEGHYKLRSLGNDVWSCYSCLRVPDKAINVGIKNKIRIGSQWATEKQLKELERRVILPYDKPGGGYYLGRRMENGKICEDRHPDYRP